MSFSPETAPEMDPLRSLLIYSSGHASACHFRDWIAMDPPRPREIQIDRHPGVDLEQCLRPDAHDDFPTAFSQHFRALHLELNETLDARLFECEPTDDYVFAEERADGRWSIRHHPTQLVQTRASRRLRCGRNGLASGWLTRGGPGAGSTVLLSAAWHVSLWDSY